MATVKIFRAAWLVIFYEVTNDMSVYKLTSMIEEQSVRVPADNSVMLQLVMRI